MNSALLEQIGKELSTYIRDTHFPSLSWEEETLSENLLTYTFETPFQKDLSFVSVSLGMTDCAHYPPLSNEELQGETNVLLKQINLYVNLLNFNEEEGRKIKTDILKKSVQLLVSRQIDAFVMPKFNQSVIEEPVPTGILSTAMVLKAAHERKERLLNTVRFYEYSVKTAT